MVLASADVAGPWGSNHLKKNMCVVGFGSAVNGTADGWTQGLKKEQSHGAPEGDTPWPSNCPAEQSMMGRKTQVMAAEGK